MPEIAVVTDSCASIPESMLEELKINWVAYYIHRGEEVLRDLVTAKRDSFYQWLATAKVLPKTANPGPGDYLQIYQSLAEEEGVQKIVSIHMTSKGSGAYAAACAAKEMIQERIPSLMIEVIDTLNVSMCHGWMVIEAARAALAGATLPEIVDLVKKIMPVTQMIQTADTLKFLYMGGRIGKAQHMMGSLLSIKPLIGMKDGIIVPLGQARSRKNAYEKMIQMVEGVVGYKGRVKIAYVHAAAREEVEKIRTLAEERLTCVESIFAELSPALGVHTGPGTAGLCYFPV
ncbi:MAG: DegV family protein [Anaerolineaceae bacterium]|nr:MAG: DegV family protein [Anaerolineaceae bacterium]